MKTMKHLLTILTIGFGCILSPNMYAQSHHSFPFTAHKTKGTVV